MSDTPETNTSSYLNQIGKMMLRIEEMKREHENKCRELRDGFGNVICDLQETIFNLRAELNNTTRASQIWKKAHSDILENRDLWMNEAERWMEIKK